MARLHAVPQRHQLRIPAATLLIAALISTLSPTASAAASPAPVPAGAQPAAQPATTNTGAEVHEASESAVDTETAALSIDPSDAVVFAATWEGDDPEVEYRLHTSEGWQPWQPVEAELDGADAAEGEEGHEHSEEHDHGDANASDPLILADADIVQARAANEAFTGAIEITTYSSPITATDESITANIATPYSSTKNSVLNRVITRESWGAKQPICDLGNANDKHATIIHHTAGSNSYTRAQVPGILRGIQTFHMSKDPTWCDIGYHMLVDKWGNIYEGRGGGVARARVGTHAAGWNSDTFGISVMGDYTYATPSNSVIHSLSRLVAWQAKYWGYDPSGTVKLLAGSGAKNAGQGVTLDRVSGHRDVGWTSCPGANLYPKLSQIRSDAKQYMKYEVARSPLTRDRVAGDSRYTTAVNATRQSHPNGARKIYIATGEEYADALVAAPAAVHENAALLLTKQSYLPSSVVNEIKRLNPQVAVIVGGTSAVSFNVAKRLRQLVPTVTRRAGDDRYSTAIRVARGAFGSADRAYIATGEDYPDALSASTVAAFHDSPVVLVRGSRSQVSTATNRALRDLGVSKVVLAGGTSVITSGMERSLATYAPWRVAGTNRYETSRRLNAHVLPKASRAFFASGDGYADALSGAALAGAKSAPLYLTKSTCVPQRMRSDVFESSVGRVTLIGGNSAISPLVGYLEPCL